MAPKPVTALGQNISFFVVHDNDGAPPAPAPAPPQPAAKRQSNQPSITTHRRTPSLTPAELAAQAKRAEAARLSAAAAVRALAEKRRPAYYEEASDDDAAPPEAEVLEKPARHRDRDRIRRHKLRKVGASDLDQIRARGAATVLSARLAATSDTVGTTITQLKQRIATKSVESIETDLARLRREIATRDPGWQRQDDEPTDVNYELDQAAAALELFETHVARAERALATVSRQAQIARDAQLRAAPARRVGVFFVGVGPVASVVRTLPRQLPVA
ncbi:hypothetical protein JL721_1126 [Aureococcus anophagefferens]|nr:hypothetical protein JL721_1126 [Aureococcus anophagefferens]